MFGRTYLALALAGLLLVLAGCGAAETPADGGAGGAAPCEERTGLFSGMDTVDLDGNAVDVSVFAENTLTLVNAWDLSCNPCIREMPALERLDRTYENVAVLGLYLNGKTGISDQARTQVHELMEAKGTTYRHLLTSQAMLDAPEYREIHVTPTTFFVDGRGGIVDVLIGTREYEEWVALVDAMLEDMGAAEETVPGTLFAAMETVDLENHDVDSTLFAENDLTLVNVWELDCVPCVEEMPILDRLDRAYGNVAVKGLYCNSDGTAGISDETRAQIGELYETAGVSYQQLAYSRAMRNAPETRDLIGFPTTYFVNSAGEIVDTVLGSRSEKEWQALIDAALSQIAKKNEKSS